MKTPEQRLAEVEYKLAQVQRELARTPARDAVPLAARHGRFLGHTAGALNGDGETVDVTIWIYSVTDGEWAVTTKTVENVRGFRGATIPLDSDVYVFYYETCWVLLPMGSNVEIVQVYHPEVTAGNVVEANAAGYHPGRIVAVSDEGYTTSIDIWIWFVDGFPDAANLAVQEEYYGPAKPTGETYDLVTNEGEEDEEHDERPIYVLEFSERQFLCKADSAISKGGSGTVSIYHSTSKADSDINREAEALGAAITGGLWCLYFRVAGQWFVSPWECPGE